MKRSDLVLLNKVLDLDLREDEREPFQEMADSLRDGTRHSLSLKQRQWAERVLDVHCPQYENLVSEGKVPRGKEVPVPEVLRNLPKRPPIRRVSED